MLLVQDILISAEVVQQKFVCNLNACKGACCWEGDFGAPLEKRELQILTDNYEVIKPFLKKEGIEVLESQGLYVWNEEPKEYGTTLLKNGACAYLTFNEAGIALCGIEQAYNAGVTDFKKPISCHLYPVRVTENEETGFVALNYDEWDICSAACSLGEQMQLPVFEFVKDAILRKFGEDFYEELRAAATHYLTHETEE